MTVPPLVKLIVVSIASPFLSNTTFLTVDGLIISLNSTLIPALSGICVAPLLGKEPKLVLTTVGATPSAAKAVVK